MVHYMERTTGWHKFEIFFWAKLTPTKENYLRCLFATQAWQKPCDKGAFQICLGKIICE